VDAEEFGDGFDRSRIRVAWRACGRRNSHSSHPRSRPAHRLCPNSRRRCDIFSSRSEAKAQSPSETAGRNAPLGAAHADLVHGGPPAPAGLSASCYPWIFFRRVLGLRMAQLHGAIFRPCRPGGTSTRCLQRELGGPWLPESRADRSPCPGRFLGMAASGQFVLDCLVHPALELHKRTGKNSISHQNYFHHICNFFGAFVYLFCVYDRLFILRQQTAFFVKFIPLY
jgi:hypothetical protein